MAVFPAGDRQVVWDGVDDTGRRVLPPARAPIALNE